MDVEGVGGEAGAGLLYFGGLYHIGEGVDVEEGIFKANAFGLCCFNNALEVGEGLRGLGILPAEAGAELAGCRDFVVYFVFGNNANVIVLRDGYLTQAYLGERHPLDTGGYGRPAKLGIFCPKFYNRAEVGILRCHGDHDVVLIELLVVLRALH